MVEVLLASVALTALLAASYADLKTREVPDWLSYGLLFSALGIRVIYSFQEGWSFLVAGLLGFGILFGIGYALYFVSQWGGGDAKLLMGMGALIGFSLPLSQTSLRIFWYFLLLLFVGALYGMGWLVWLLFRNWKKISLPLKMKVVSYRKLHVAMLVSTVFFLVLALAEPVVWPLVFFPLPLFYLFIAIGVVEETCFYKKVRPQELTEGDWLAKDIMVDGKLVVEKKTLEREDIVKLRHRKVSSVLIKEGIPFVPSFLLAYIIFLFSGELWRYLVA